VETLGELAEGDLFGVVSTQILLHRCGQLLLRRSFREGKTRLLHLKDYLLKPVSVEEPRTASGAPRPGPQ